MYSSEPHCLALRSVNRDCRQQLWSEKFNSLNFFTSPLRLFTSTHKFHRHILTRIQFKKLHFPCLHFPQGHVVDLFLLVGGVWRSRSVAAHTLQANLSGAKFVVFPSFQVYKTATRRCLQIIFLGKCGNATCSGQLLGY